MPGSSGAVLAASFFETPDGAWFVPTAAARGPWDPSACHAGPPSGLLARALERTLPTQALRRIWVDLHRPVPMAGFWVRAELEREGRSVGRARAWIEDGQGRTVAEARGVFLTERSLGELPSAPAASPPLPSSPADRSWAPTGIHDQPCFPDAVELRRVPAESAWPNTVWMRAPPLIAGEADTPFASICPLADCGNALGRLADARETSFLNFDLAITLHRSPEGPWFAGTAQSVWEPSGTGRSELHLFDREGPVGVAMQTLLLSRASD